MAGNITPYEINAGTQAPFTPSEEGPRVLQESARMVHAYSEQAGQSYERLGDELQSGLDSTAVLHGTQAMSQMQMNQQKEWHDFMNSPDAGDPQKVQAMRQKQADEVNQFQSSFSSNPLLSDKVREHFTIESSDYSKRMYEKQIGDLSTYAGIQAVGAMNEVERNAQNMAEADPLHGVQNGMQLLDGTLEAARTNPNMDFEQQAKFSEEIEKSKGALVINGALGLMDKNPQAALDELENGDYSVNGQFGKYIDARQRRTLITEANGAINRVGAQARTADELKTKEMNRDFNNTVNQSVADNVTWDTSGQPTVNPQIWKDINTLHREALLSGGRVAPDKLDSVTNYVTKLQTDMRKGIDPTTDMGTYGALWPRVETGQATVSQIQDAYTAGHLSREDTKRMIDKLNDPSRKDPMWARVYDRETNAANAAKPFILSDTSIVTPQMRQRYGEFQNHLSDLVDDARASNMSPPATRDKYFNPSNPKDYVLSPANLAPYQIGNKAGLSQATQDIKADKAVPLAAPAAPKVPRNPNESPEDYLKRVGGG